MKIERKRLKEKRGENQPLWTHINISNYVN